MKIVQSHAHTSVNGGHTGDGVAKNERCTPSPAVSSDIIETFRRLRILQVDQRTSSWRGESLGRVPAHDRVTVMSYRSMATGTTSWGFDRVNSPGTRRRLPTSSCKLSREIVDWATDLAPE